MPDTYDSIINDIQIPVQNNSEYKNNNNTQYNLNQRTQISDKQDNKRDQQERQAIQEKQKTVKNHNSNQYVFKFSPPRNQENKKQNLQYQYNDYPASQDASFVGKLKSNNQLDNSYFSQNSYKKTELETQVLSQPTSHKKPNYEFTKEQDKHYSPRLQHQNNMTQNQNKFQNQINYKQIQDQDLNYVRLNLNQKVQNKIFDKQQNNSNGLQSQKSLNSNPSQLQKLQQNNFSEEQINNLALNIFKTAVQELEKVNIKNYQQVQKKQNKKIENNGNDEKYSQKDYENEQKYDIIQQKPENNNSQIIEQPYKNQTQQKRLSIDRQASFNQFLEQDIHQTNQEKNLKNQSYENYKKL
ncbi:hypothetical protein PPERSA_12627 [Pseudocohnilembus persalinus]|uniref:Uncharacterized protein n=1 Tax=Pseudocohnilembus persalinus TaxID=266149 RepID=A0A0V0QCT7_PSEPJ|nr:hypothetical protein PPERSA_12627 [Pseudocohnilembus persalinus]|eukprot:KRW99951.1 hypothetical protein PPERSA_12627 [Pseudocohnilembus persalinus]